MALARQEINHGLPSIDLHSSKRELFNSYIALQAGTKSIPGSYGTHHDLYHNLTLLLDSGIVFPASYLDQAIEALIAQGPQEAFIPLYERWHALPTLHVTKHHPEIAQTWYDSIATIQNPFTRADRSVRWYRETIESDLKQEALKTYVTIHLDHLRGLLPSYEEATHLFDWTTPASAALFGRRSLSDVTNFLFQLQESGLGYMVEDVDTYIIGLLETLPIRATDGQTLETIIDYTSRSTISEQKDIYATLVRVLNSISSHPDSKTQERVNKALTRAFLLLNLIPQAKSAWAKLAYEPALSTMKHVIANAAHHGQIDTVAPLWESELLSKPQAPDTVGFDSRHAREIRLNWFFAAEGLANSRLSLLSKPELIQFLSDPDTDLFLPSLTRLSKLFPQEVRFRDALKKQLKTATIAFNNGKLPDASAASLFEALLLFR